jgi:WXG100 protein secretion system (Wss), protein YukD
VQNTDVCRVSIQLGGTQADIALPDHIPVGQLMPSVCDVLSRPPGEAPTCLHLPGQPPLDLSMTLSEQGIRDGALLVLAPVADPPPRAPVVHATDAVEQAAAERTRGWTAQATRLAALLAATAMAGVTGLVAVPGGIGTPSLLLGTAAAAAAAAISASLSRDGRTTLMALTCLCTLIAVAALGATLFGLSDRTAALALTVTAVGVLTISGRLSVLISGLPQHIAADLDPGHDRLDEDLWSRAGQAQQVLTALVVAAAIAAAVGAAAVTFTSGSSRWVDLALAWIITAVLLIRSRSHSEPARRASLLASGTGCAAALFVALAAHVPALTPWICAAAAASATAAAWLGFHPLSTAGPPHLRRWFDIVDCGVLVCVIPLAGWSCGLYGFVRGIGL